MSTDLDPRLQALFEQANETFDGDRFLDDLMRQVDRQRRRTVIAWSVVGLVVLTVFVFLAGPVLMAVDMVSSLLPVSVVEIETEWLQKLLSPINSVAAAVAIGGLLVAKFFRRIFR